MKMILNDNDMRKKKNASATACKDKAALEKSE